MEPGTIVGAIGSSIGTIESIWNRVKGRFEGLDIEIRSLGFRDTRKWNSVFTMITRNPLAYIGTFQISNGTAQRRGIKKVELVINDKSFAWDEDELESFSSGDVRTVQWVFPAAEDAPRSGMFILRITDSSGKIRKIPGQIANDSD